MKPKTPKKKDKKPKEEELKPRARGANERESHTVLKKWLEQGPPQSDEEDNTPEPKSAFDWDTDNEEQQSKVSRFFRKRKRPKELKHDGNSRDRRNIGGAVVGEESATIPRIASGIYAAKSPSLSRMVGESMWERGYGSVSGSSARSPPAYLERSSKTSSEAAESPSVNKRSDPPTGPSPALRESPTTAVPEGDNPMLSKFASQFKRTASDTDLRNRSVMTGNAFAQEEARKKVLPRPEDAIHGANVSANTAVCWSDATPTKSSVGRIVEKLKLSPSPTHIQSPTASMNSSFTNPSSRGMPHGPEDPDWDDAVKWVRKEINKREAKEAKEARELQREAKKEEKRVKKLHAAKDAIKRQSQQGLILKRSVEQITEDDFEAVGAAAMALDSPTPTTNPDLLGAFFTKMEGTTQDKARQAHEIGHSLDNHASLHLLNQEEATSTEVGEETYSHHDAALRMLTGETPFPNELVNPFVEAPSAGGFPSNPSVGLGITHVEASQEVLAAENRAKAQMSLDELRYTRDAEERTQMTGLSPAQVPYDPQMPLYNRPMTTIQEVEKESSSSQSGSRGRPSRSPRENLSGKTSPYVDSTDESLENEPTLARASQMKQEIRNLRYGPRISRDDDAKSIDTIESDAIPAPLDILKTRGPRTSPRFVDRSPHSPKIPIVHVSKSSQDLERSESNSFFPRRNSSFNKMIEETSRLQATRIGSHPAFRDVADEYIYDTESEYSYYDDHDTPRGSIQKSARVDSGIGFAEREVVEEDYRTSSLGQNEFESATSSPAEKSVPHRKRVPTLRAPDDAASQQAMGIDLQTLRREVGLPPLELPAGPDSPNHPNHHFTWHHEKLMCYGIHNARDKQLTMPSIPETQSAEASSSPFKATPTKAKIMGVKMCAICGIQCCRYANLVLSTKIIQSTDVAAESIRIKAVENVEKLRCHHPNGIETYDTFLTCLQCDLKICPGCSIKCMEQACQAVICVECAPETGVCPVHNEE